jgi:phosphoglycerate dehydrogenase-like enzyme
MHACLIRRNACPLKAALRCEVAAPNRAGSSFGTPERLNELLEAADVLLISAPLTRATHSLRESAHLNQKSPHKPPRTSTAS